MKRGPARTLTLDAHEILRYHRRGMTLAEIGYPYGVTRAAVSARLRRANVDPLRRGRKPRRVSAIPQAT